MSEKYNTEMDDCNVICPYCGSAYQAEAEDYNSTEREEECRKCKKVYLVYQDFDVTHHTRTK
jgi:hypothetical protein